MIDIRLYILGGLALLVVLALIYLIFALIQHSRAVREARSAAVREAVTVGLHDADIVTAGSTGLSASAWRAQPDSTEAAVSTSPAAEAPVAPPAVVPVLDPAGPVIPGADGLFGVVSAPVQRFPLCDHERAVVPSLPVIVAVPAHPPVAAEPVVADIPAYSPVSSVELTFQTGGPVGVKPGTPTFAEFRRMGDAMLAEMDRTVSR